MTSNLRIQFLGAANTVTGSRYLLEHQQQRWLVDCGQFQGYKYLRERNWQRFAVDPASIDAVFLTHAHIDHSGYLPVLVGSGFRGPIYCTAATRDLCEVLLLDAAHLQEEEADYLNRHRLSKHRPARPLFTRREVEKTLRQMHAVPFDNDLELDGGRVTFHANGHILGSAAVQIAIGGKTVLFSGDMGRPHDDLMKPPQPPCYCDYLVLESTYGDRLHGNGDVSHRLADIISETVRRGGSILIPSFAVGRAQLIIYLLHRLRRENRIPPIPIYLDSPMAIKATEIFNRHHGLHKLSGPETRAMCESIHYVRTVQESIALNRVQVPKVIISASGMATGGRVLHHLKNLLEHSDNSVVFAGYQSGGTRGARLVGGEDRVKIHGRYFHVKAGIHSLDNLSAHADYNELLQWLRKIPVAPKRSFITHGEAQAADAMRVRLQDELGWPACVPDQGEQVEL